MAMYGRYQLRRHQCMQNSTTSSNRSQSNNRNGWVIPKDVNVTTYTSAYVTTYVYNRRAFLLRRSFDNILRLELQMSLFSSSQVLTTRVTYNIAYLPVYLICLSICTYVMSYARPLTADSSSLSLSPQQSSLVFSLRPPQSLPVPECPPPPRVHHKLGATYMKLICTICTYI